MALLPAKELKAVRLISETCVHVVASYFTSAQNEKRMMLQLPLLCIAHIDHTIVSDRASI